MKVVTLFRWLRVISIVASTCMIVSTIGCMMYLYWNGYFSLKTIATYKPLFEISQQPEQPVEIISYFCPYPNETTLRKSKLTAFLISFFVGVLGFDRFYLSHLITGLVKLCVCKLKFIVSCED